jgi:Tfp pilus assembly protein PilN
MRRPANLASRPFRNERLPATLRVLGLLAISIQHALLVRRLLPDATSARHAEAAALEAEVARLRADGLALRGPAPDKASLARWVAVKEMVDRRSFAWTLLLGRLEKTIPPGVRLVSVSPGWEKGRLRLGLRVLARTSDAGFELVQALEDQPDFEEVYPLSKQGDAGSGDGFQFELTMLYRASAAPAEAGSDAPAGSAEDVG